MRVKGRERETRNGEKEGEKRVGSKMVASSHAVAI